MVRALSDATVTRLSKSLVSVLLLLALVAGGFQVWADGAGAIPGVAASLVSIAAVAYGVLTDSLYEPAVQLAIALGLVLLGIRALGSTPALAAFVLVGGVGLGVAQLVSLVRTRR